MPDFAAERGFDLELASGFEPELDLVTDATRHPPIFSDPRHCSEAHPRGERHDLEDLGHCFDTRDSGDIVLDIWHEALSKPPCIAGSQIIGRE